MVEHRPLKLDRFSFPVRLYWRVED